MFLGTHTPKLDEKGRLILPAKYRDELSDGLVITRFQERCLAIWPIKTFVDVTEAVRTASSSQQIVRDYQRMLASGASDDTPDKQGGSPSRRTCGCTRGSTRTAWSSGAITRVEVWDVGAWERYSAEKESAYADLNETVFPGI